MSTVTSTVLGTVIATVTPSIPTDGGGNPVSPPLNFRTTLVTDSQVDLAWSDNPANAGAATGYTLSRAGQPDVQLPAGTTTYTDTRDIAPDAQYTWFLTLTTAGGTSNPVVTSAQTQRAFVMATGQWNDGGRWYDDAVWNDTGTP